jgi:predicted dinucleotide-binding enzyme
MHVRALVILLLVPCTASAPAFAQVEGTLRKVVIDLRALIGKRPARSR